MRLVGRVAGILFVFGAAAHLAAGQSGQAQSNTPLEAMKTVLAYGAKCDTMTDDTAAFNASIAAQGLAYVPAGRCLVNLVITQNNVRIIGQAFSDASPINSSLRPFDRTRPVIQIGNDSERVRGVRLDGISLYAVNNGMSGAVGLYLAGGAYANYFTGISIAGFTQYGIRIQGGARYPAALNFFDGLNLVVAPNNVAGLASLPARGGNANDDSFTAANYFSNARISGSTTGWAVEVDSSDLHFSSTWIQARNGHGLKLTNSANITPYVYASDLSIDSDDSTDTLLTLYDNDRIISNHLRGTFNIDGVAALANGTKVTLTGTTSFAARLDSHTVQKAGGSMYGWTPVVVFDVTSPIGNTGGETDLRVFRLPANALDADRQRIQCEAYGDLAANANRKSIRTYVGGTLVTAVDTTASAVGWHARWTLVRTGSTTGTAFGSIDYGGSSDTEPTRSVPLNPAAVIPLKVTGQGGAANDVTAQHVECSWLPATP